MRKLRITLLLIVAAVMSTVGYAQSQSNIKSGPQKTAYLTPKGTPYCYELNAYVNVNGDTHWIGNYADTIYVDGTDVYIKDLVHSQVADGSYAKGQLTKGDIHNGQITFANGVDIAQGGVKGYLANNVDGAYEVNDTTASFTFSINNDTITIDSTKAFGRTYILGYDPATKDGDGPDGLVHYWDGYTTNYKYIPFDASSLQSVTVPAGIIKQTWKTTCKPQTTGGDYAVFLNKTVKDGNDVYLSRLLRDYPDIAVKGTIDGDSILIDLPLYVGKTQNMYTYLDAGQSYSYEDDDDETVYDYKMIDRKQIKLGYDATTNTITSDYAFIFHADKHIFGQLNCPTFAPFTEKATAMPESATPTEYIRLNLTSPDQSVAMPTKQNIYADGNDRYFEDTYGNTTFDVKGTLNTAGDSLLVNVPQYLGESKSGSLIYFDDVRVDSALVFGTWIYTYTAKEQPNVLKFAVKNGKINFDGSIGLHAAGISMSSAIINPQWIIMKDTVAVVPSDAVVDSYKFNSFNPDGSSATSSTIRIAHKGNTYYFLDHDSYYPNGAFVGTLNGDELTVNAGQLLDDVNYIYLRPAELIRNSDGTFGYKLIDKAQVTFSYDDYTKTFSYDKMLMLFSIGDGLLSFYNIPTYTMIDLSNVKLNSPVPLSWSDEDLATLKTYTFKSTIPYTTTTGMELDKSKMTYRFYFDDNIYTFTYDKYGYYDYFDKDTVDIPYTYSAMDFVYQGASHTNYFVDKPNKLIGLQSCYTEGTQKVWSDIVDFDIDSQTIVTGIDSKMNGENILSDEVFDLSGRRVSTPQKGMFIHKIKYNDGKMKTFKELKK
jgi:hypothetical protein